MTTFNRAIFVSVAIGVIFASHAIFTLYDYYKPRTFCDNGVSDEAYIAITNQTLEAQRFLEKYPNAVIQVDRSGSLAVDYRANTSSTQRYLRLRIFIHWRINKPDDIFVDNLGTYIKEDILEYLETVAFPN